MAMIKRYIEGQKSKGNLVQCEETGQLAPTLSYLFSDRKEPLIEDIIQKDGNYTYTRHGRFRRDQDG